MACPTSLMGRTPELAQCPHRQISLTRPMCYLSLLETQWILLFTGFFSTSRKISIRMISSQRKSTTFRSRAEICLGATLRSCTYLSACIEEGQQPASGPTFWREAALGSATLCGEYIPPGSEAAICMRAINHNAEYFLSPFSYEPERWLPSEIDLPSNNV